MAIDPHVQSRSVDFGPGTSASLAFTSDNLVGNTIVVSCRVGDAGASVARTVSDTRGNTYILARSQVSGSSDHTLHVYYALNISSGPNTVTFNISPNSATLRLAIQEIAGVNLFDKVNSASGTSTSIDSGNITTTVADEAIFAVCSTINNQTFTAGTNYTIRELPANKSATEDKVVAATGTYSGSFSIGATDSWACIVVSFKGVSFNNDAGTITSSATLNNQANKNFSGAFSTGAITIGWDASPGATGYKVYYGTTSSVYTTIIDVGNVLTYRVTNLPSNTYYFAITAYNGSGESGFSSEISDIILGGIYSTLANSRIQFITVSGNITPSGTNSIVSQNTFNGLLAPTANVIRVTQTNLSGAMNVQGDITASTLVTIIYKDLLDDMFHIRYYFGDW